MMSNLVSQLEIQKAGDRLPDVLTEIPRVRAEVGYPPLVTPMSQIVGTQAVLNVLTGKRWSVIPREMKDYVRGYYGKAPGPMDRDIVAKVLGGEEMIPADVRPGSLVKTTYDEMAAEIGDLAKSEEDVLMYALFPVEARQYLTAHKEGAESAVFMLSGEINAFREDESVDVNQIRELIKIVEASEIGEVVVEENGAIITVRKGSFVVSSSAAAGAAAPSGAAELSTTPVAEGARPESWKEVRAQMVGTFYHAPSPGAEPFVKVGDAFDEGHPLCILEAMKLMNEIEAPENGVIREAPVSDGAPVEYGTVLFYYEPTA
jgi:oxaloacetate decarboxylase alpha subunit